MKRGKNSTQIMSKDYIRAHEVIQETVKQLKMLKEQRALHFLEMKR
jgi:hypothetical protein